MEKSLIWQKKEFHPGTIIFTFIWLILTLIFNFFFWEYIASSRVYFLIVAVTILLLITFLYRHIKSIDLGFIFLICMSIPVLILTFHTYGFILIIGAYLTLLAIEIHCQYESKLLSKQKFQFKTRDENLSKILNKFYKILQQNLKDSFSPIKVKKIDFRNYNIHIGNKNRKDKSFKIKVKISNYSRLSKGKRLYIIEITIKKLNQGAKDATINQVKNIIERIIKYLLLKKNN